MRVTQANAAIRVMVVDDHVIVRQGLTSLIARKPGVEVVAEAGNADEAIRLFRERRPDVTLMDLHLPGTSGVEAIEAIRKEFQDSRFIVLTTFDRDEYICDAFQAGARAYVLKSRVGADELVEIVKRVHAGERHIPEEIAALLADRLFNPVLTPRELDVLRLVAKGQENKEIASALGISPGTVKTHILKIFEKLEVNDRASATRAAVKRGLIRSPF